MILTGSLVHSVTETSYGQYSAPDVKIRVVLSEGYEKSSYQLVEAAKMPDIMEPEVPGKPASGHLITGENLTIPSEISAEYIDIKLKGTAMEGLGGAFKEAEKKYGVNALFLVGLAIHESGFGTSKLAKSKNNLFGFRAYDRSPMKSAADFRSKEECIDAVARYLSKNYLNPGGKYFKGYGIADIGVYYATDPMWSSGVQRSVIRFIEKE